MTQAHRRYNAMKWPGNRQCRHAMRTNKKAASPEAVSFFNQGDRDEETFRHSGHRVADSLRSC